MFQWLGRTHQPVGQSPTKFLISITPETIDSSSTIVVMCHADQHQKTQVPCRFEWTRVWQGRREQIAHCRGNAYTCNPFDVGAIIDVLVTSLDEQYPGSRQLSFGPIQIDTMLKRSIEKMLVLDRGSFPVQFSCGNTNIHNIQCTVAINQQSIKLKDDHGDNYYRFSYLPGQPPISMHSTDITKVELTVAQGSQADFIHFLRCLTGNTISSANYDKYSLHFVNRISRDMFIIALQAFASKKTLIANHIIDTLQKRTFEGTQFDLLLQIDGLRRYIKCTELQKQKVQGQVRFYKDEVKRLQQEMENVRFTFSSLIQKSCKFQADLAQISYIATVKGQQQPQIKTVIEQIQLKEGKPSADPSLDMDRSKLTTRKEAMLNRYNDSTALGQTASKSLAYRYERKIEQLQQQLEAEQKTIVDLNQLVGYYSKLTANLDELENSNSRLRAQNQSLHREVQKLKRATSDEQLNKWKKRYDSAQQEIKILRRGNEQLSKSRILSMELDEAVQQDYNLLKEQCHMLTEENKKLAETCSRYVPIIKQASELKHELQRLQSVANRCQP